MAAEWLGIPAAFVAWVFALYIFVVAPPTRGARFLVAMLAIDGMAIISSHENPVYVDRFLADAFGLTGLNWRDIHQASDWALIAVYLPFLGMTLESPLVAPLKNVLIRRAILYGGLAIALSMFVLTETTQEHFRVPFYIVICFVLTWGFVAALHSWYIATNEAKRQRAKAFAMAFGMRDVLWALSFALIALHYYGYFGEFDPTRRDALFFAVVIPYIVAVMLYVPLVAYGVLRVQLFDIDLRIKRTLKRSTVAAAFVATFFVASELAENFLSDQLGTVLGIICTGALVFVLDPIQRAAERLSNAAMPNTLDTAEYESYRKLQVYENALQAALEDSHISKRQRRVLDSMIESMGIDAEVAKRLEEDALKTSRNL